MTQPVEAVGGEAQSPVEPTAESFGTELAKDVFGITDEEEEQPAEEGEQPVEGAEAETAVEEEADDLPPIEPPVSWDAEAKDVFKSLPREAQEIVAKREGEREKFVQQKSQEAARVKTEVEQTAVQQLAQIEAGYAQQFQHLAEQIMPQRPNPALVQVDPAAFYAQQAQYEAAVAQQRELQQQAQTYAQQAQLRAAQIEQATHAEQHRIIVDNFPEYADPTSGPELQRKLTAVAKAMGYPDELIGQARATDILAVRAASEWKAKADKYDALMSKKMENVRAAKVAPPVSRPGVSQGPDQLRARNAQAALDTALTSKNRDVQGAAFFDYLKTTGQVK